MIKTLFNTLDQNINIDSNYICRRFELIVFKKELIRGLKVARASFTRKNLFN